jgi:hypothetical protein
MIVKKTNTIVYEINFIDMKIASISGGFCLIYSYILDSDTCMYIICKHFFCFIICKHYKFYLRVQLLK